MIEEYKEGEYCRVAVCNIIGAKNEDRWAYKTSHGDVNPNCEDLSSFSIFDGHASKAVSEYLSKRLGDNVVHALSSRMAAEERFSPAMAAELATTPKINRIDPSLVRTSSNASTVSSEVDYDGGISGDDGDGNVGMDLGDDDGGLEPAKASQSSPLLANLSVDSDSGSGRNRRSASVQSSVELDVRRMSDSDKFDAFFCDAINTEVQRIDRNIREKNAAGSTYCGLFLKKESNGVIRAFCANVGDSRCLMVTVDSQFIPTAAKGRGDSDDFLDSTHAASSVWDSEHMNDRTNEFKLLTRSDSKIGMSSIEEHMEPATATKSATPVGKMVEVPSSAKLSDRVAGIKRNDSIVQFRSAVSDANLGGSNGDPLGFSNHSERSAFAGSDASEHPSISSDGEGTSLANIPPGALLWGKKSQQPLSGVNRLTTVVYMMSEDHSLANARERKRIGTHKGNFRYDIPAEACIISPPGMIPSHLLHSDEDAVVRRSSTAANESSGNEGGASPSQEELRLANSPGRSGDGYGAAPEASNQRKTAFDYYLSEALRTGSPTRKLIKASVAYIERLKLLIDRHGNAPSPLFDASVRLRLATDTAPLADSPVATRKSMTLPISTNRLDEDIHVPKDFEQGANVAAFPQISTSDSAEGAEGATTAKDDGLSNYPDDLICPQQMYKHSFISRRVSSDGRTMGPEAIFGRFNVSIMMTRSIGDKFGPRSCIAVPEIATINVPKSQFVRFILASDGFWDVASYETVRRAAMKRKYSDPRVLAKHLADKGKRYRNKKLMRADDITVMVVDVNADEINTVDGPDGVQSVSVERGPDGQLREVESGCVPSKCTVS